MLVVLQIETPIDVWNAYKHCLPTRRRCDLRIEWRHGKFLGIQDDRSSTSIAVHAGARCRAQSGQVPRSGDVLRQARTASRWLGIYDTHLEEPRRKSDS